jgi:hypothetical protein
VTARDPFVLTLTVCYQTQLITAGLRRLSVSCCPIRSDEGGEQYKEAGPMIGFRPLLAV